MDTTNKTDIFAIPRLISFSAEMWFVTGITVTLLVVTSIPYVYGYISCPQGKWFSGIVYNVHDTAQYLSWVREAGTSFLSENKLTAEPNARVFVNLHWWILGRLAYMFGLTFSQVYQLFRLAAITLLTLITYAFCALLFEDHLKRRFALLLSICTSGLGWFWVAVKHATSAANVPFPHDIYTTPGNAFWVMMTSPHLTLAAALTVGVLFLALLAVQQRRFRYALGAALMALFLGLGHIYDLVTVWAVLAFFGLLLVLRDGWSWRIFSYLALVVLVSAPAPFYWGWVASDAHPIWKQALAQYDNLGAFTPDPLHLVILLGATFLLALATFDGLVPLRNHTDGRLLIKCWFVLLPFLVYLPLKFQIMLLTGYNFPMAALATVGLFDRVLPWLRERNSRYPHRRRLAIASLSRTIPMLFLLAVSMTNLYLLAWRVFDLHRHDYPFYLYHDEVAAMRWLERYTPPNEVVLTAFVLGHYIPGLTGDRTFLGNAVMTMDFNRKQELLNAFFDSMTSDGERQALIRKYGIRYVFYGPAERALGNYSPSNSTFFVKVFSSPHTCIYAATTGPLGSSVASRN